MSDIYSINYHLLENSLYPSVGKLLEDRLTYREFGPKLQESPYIAHTIIRSSKVEQVHLHCPLRMIQKKALAKDHLMLEKWPLQVGAANTSKLTSLARECFIELEC